MFVAKNCWLEKDFGQKCLFVQQKLWFAKIVGRKNFRSEIFFGQKKV
jgi:hypothetical protein